MKRTVLAATLFLAVACSQPAKPTGPLYLDPSAELEARVEDALYGKSIGEEARYREKDVLLYISDPECSVDRPEKELKGFEKVWLEPGQTKTVSIAIDESALSFFDETSHSWVAETGEFVACVGAASDDIRTTVKFNLK